MKRKALRQRSPGRVDDEADYRALSAAVRVEFHGACALGPIIATLPAHVRKGHRCAGVQQGLHHLRKLSDAGAYVLRANVLPSCNNCNGWVEDHPGGDADEPGALELGLVIRPGHPDYDQLGKRAARLAR